MVMLLSLRQLSSTTLFRDRFRICAVNLKVGAYAQRRGGFTLDREFGKP